MAQTQEQIAFIVNEWEQKYKPTTLLNCEHNVNEIVTWVNREGGDITIQKLVDAVRNLGDIDNGGRLQYHHAPKEVVVVKAPAETAQQKRQRELVEKDIAGFQKGIRTEWDRPAPKREVVEKKAHIMPTVADNDGLPESPAGLPIVNTLKDVRALSTEEYRRAYYRHPNSAAWARRVDAIIQKEGIRTSHYR